MTMITIAVGETILIVSSNYYIAALQDMICVTCLIRYELTTTYMLDEIIRGIAFGFD